MATFGRNRQSIADIQQQLQEFFINHPKTQYNDQGEPVIPADSLVDVFDAFEDLYAGVRLLDGDETILFQNFLKQNPGLQCTPAILVQYIAQKTRHSPPRSPASTDEDNERGRSSDRDEGHPRSSSSDSNWSSIGAPQTPLSARSPFDNERRQRSTPLASHAPSSWSTKRPAPANRRKSDGGSRSDSEFSTSPSAYGRTSGGRTRAPSNPTSPAMSPTFSPPSRPHSRAQSHSQSSFSSFADDNDDTIDASPLYDYRGRRNDDAFLKSVSSLPMPRGEDSDPEDDDSSLGLVMDRTTTSSTVSMETMDRVDVLQRANEELSRKLNDAEKTLQNKLSEHESELEEMQGRLEEMRSELNATKREEKELRSKERQNMTQIAQLELEIQKVTKALEHARSTYTSLQRQYQEQCAASERYRDDLRQREELIRSLRDAASLHEMETTKWAKEHESYEARFALLEDDLSIAHQAHVQLDEQKQENLLLKETIDRMRFDMDEMRHNIVVSHGNGGSGQSSAANTMSRSLGAELAGKLDSKGGWEVEEQEEQEVVEQVLDDSLEVEEDEETEGEDVIQTIITRTKRKVASRANRMGMETRMFEETKEYSDSSCQYDPHLLYATHHTQTDLAPKIIRVSLSTQTDEPRLSTFATQTDPESVLIPRIMTEIEVQTDDVGGEEEDEASGLGSGSVSPPAEQVESLASSSSTIVPPTPRARPQTLELQPQDEPPAYTYDHLNPSEQEWSGRALADILRKYHPGAKIPFEPAPESVEGCVSPEAVEEWKALKEELGVECLVIDKVIEQSQAARRTTPKGKRRTSGASRFYNIYNTYVYGDKNSTASFLSTTASIALWIGTSALVLLAASPYIVPQYMYGNVAVPGGPTYYDRAAWSSFNSMQAAGEGFSPDVYGSGASVWWNFLGRVGGGAARIARGWPT
ncbi:hypothetical protein H2248_008098 [Termitomyces sp. 'cryptogamus']|nr:hypothetical protein H2248_008098 [Termitomyces sp. 'cryptogamus']